MNTTLLKDTLGWGVGLWFIGYALGFIFFAAVPPHLIGWIIMPIGTVITLWVLVRKIRNESFPYYVLLGSVWTIVAMVCDYLFLVLLLSPADGYYKTDVYVYYALTFALPVLVGWYKSRVH